MCRIDDCVRIEGYHSWTVKAARKSHQCDECCRQVEPGESYQRTKGICEGYPFSAVICSHCRVAASWLIANCGGFVHEQVLEEIEEHAEEYPSIAEPLRTVAAGMRAKWQSIPLPGMPPPIPVLVKSDAPA